MSWKVQRNSFIYDPVAPLNPNAKVSSIISEIVLAGKMNSYKFNKL
jgi:hypothetical protein